MEKKMLMNRRKERKKLELLGLDATADGDIDKEERLKEVPRMDELVKQYLRRYNERTSSDDDLSASKREQEYYSQLLLGRDRNDPSSSVGTAMGRKSQIIENAYAFALRQQQVLLQGDVTGIVESAEKVEALLEEEARANRREGYGISREVKAWREGGATTADEEKENDSSKKEHTSYPSILHSKPRSIRALSIWTARLQSIPYHRWTIGATTALDHWIAREVLGMDENTWTLVLEGGGADVSKLNVLPGGETRGGIAERMKDIVVTREALFPETVMGSSSGITGELDGEFDADLEDETSKSIDALLASLGSFDDDDFKFDDDDDKKTDEDVVKNKESVEVIMNELQEWRAKNVESPFEKWDAQTTNEFDVSFIL
jgi:hypothetical protein